MYRQCGYCGARVPEKGSEFCNNRCFMKKQRVKPPSKTAVEPSVNGFMLGVMAASFYRMSKRQYKQSSDHEAQAEQD